MQIITRKEIEKKLAYKMRFNIASAENINDKRAYVLSAISDQFLKFKTIVEEVSKIIDPNPDVIAKLDEGFTIEDIAEMNQRFLEETLIAINKQDFLGLYEKKGDEWHLIKPHRMRQAAVMWLINRIGEIAEKENIANDSEEFEKLIAECENGIIAFKEYNYRILNNDVDVIDAKEIEG